ncbi:Homeodomain-like protein, partial [Paraphysoderma sedebokerense]
KDSDDSSASVKRSRLTREQTSVLKRVYSLTYFPDKATKEQLSKELNIPVRTIQIWFQNQRQYHRLKMKKKALQ